MTDRTPASAPPEPDNQADALVQLYHEANAQDAQNTGPSSAASERILAHARAQATRGPATPPATATPTLPMAPGPHTAYRGEPANDRRWLRQALGSLAAIGLVGWLTWHHLEEPGAPQLDSPAPASAPQALPPQPAPATTTPPAADTSAEAPVPVAPVAIAAAGAEKAAPAQEPAAAEMAKNTQHAERRAPSAAALKNDKPAAAAAAPPAAAPASEAVAASGQRPAPTQPAASAAGYQRTAPAAAAPAAVARTDSSVQAEVLADAAPSAPSAAKRKKDKAELPYCDSAMSEQDLAEQDRRIQVRADALAARQPLPEPAPVCRPWPKKLSPVPTPPIDSR